MGKKLIASLANIDDSVACKRASQSKSKGHPK